MSTITSDAKDIPQNGEPALDGTPPDAEAPKEVRLSTYVVFGTEDDPQVLDDARWVALGQYTIEGNGGQTAAKKAALKDTTNAAWLRAIHSGGDVWLFACPAQSFRPTKPGLKQKDPELVV